MTPILNSFETLCDKEFDLARAEAYENLDREIANIREYFSVRGSLQSSGMAQAIADAILARYDAILDAFERATSVSGRSPIRPFRNLNSTG